MTISRLSVALTCSMILAAGLLLAPDAARAGKNACGMLSSNAATCSNQAYTTGILYNNEASPIAITIPGGAATTISATGNGGWHSAVVIRPGSHASEDRSIDLDVGTTGAVAITQGSNTAANAWYNHMGIFVYQEAAGTIDVDVGSGRW